MIAVSLPCVCGERRSSKYRKHNELLVDYTGRPDPVEDHERGNLRRCWDPDQNRVVHSHD